MPTVDELLVVIDATTERLRREMRQADGQVQRFQRNVDRNVGSIERRFGRMGQQIQRTMRILLPALSVAAFTQGARRAIEYADAIGVTSDRLGVSVEKLQEWRFAAEEVANVQSGQADTALQRFTRRIGEAQQGYGVLLTEIERYDIALRNNDGTLRTVDEVMRDYFDTVQNAATAQEQLRLTTQAMDQEGGPLVNLMRQGAEGWDRYAAAAREAGILNTEQVEQAQELDSELTALSQTLNTSLAEAFISMGPIIQGFVGAVAVAARAVAYTINTFDSALQRLGLSESDGPDVDALQRILTRFEATGNTLSAITGGSAVGRGQRFDALQELGVWRPDFMEAFRAGDLEESTRIIQDYISTRIGLNALVTDLGDISIGGGGGGGGQGDGQAAFLQNLEAETQAIIRQTEAVATLNDQQLNRVDIGLRLQEAAGGPILGSPEDLAAIQAVIDENDAAQAAFRLTEEAADLANDALGRTGPSAEVFAMAINLVEVNAERLGLTAEQVADATEALTDQWEELSQDENLINLEQIGQQAGQSIAGAFEEAIFQGKELSEVLGALAEDLARLVLQQTVLGPVSGLISTGIGSLFGAIGGGAVGGATQGFSTGHEGGLVENLPRYHSGGVAGLLPNEVPAILQKGEGVFTRDQMKAMGGSSIVVNAPISIDAKAVGPNGVDPAAADAAGRQMRQAVRQAVQSEIAQQSRVGGILNRV